MQYILVAVGKETPDLSAVEICKAIEEIHLGVKAAFIIRGYDDSFDEDLSVGEFFTTENALKRLGSHVLEDH